MSLLKHASGVLPLAVQHLPQTKSTASAGERTATPTPTSLQNFVVGATVSIRHRHVRRPDRRPLGLRLRKRADRETDAGQPVKKHASGNVAQA
jgi:hypothetical protein